MSRVTESNQQEDQDPEQGKNYYRVIYCDSRTDCCTID